MKTHIRFFRRKLAAASVLVAFAAPTSVHAFEIKNQAGEVIGSFDTTISLGASWRAQGRDPALVGITNGGTSRDINSDDGNLNYDKNKLFSNPLKVTLDLGLKRDNYGFFGRGTYFYDFAYQDQTVSPVTGYGPTGKDRMGSDAELLDAFVYGSFRSFGERTLNARLGNQVVSWGESTFIPNGINVINGVDVAKLRAPGSELKEALRPTPMVWASQGLTDRLTIEGFYSLKWRETRIDPRGTFFSTTDALSPDGDRVFVGSGRRVDQHFAPGTFIPGVAQSAAVWAPRSQDREPGDSGEYGLTLRTLVPEWNNTELGLHYVNYHSRTPFLSGFRGGATVAASAGIGGCLTPNFGFLLTGGAVGALCTAPATYFADYPENIRLFGLSFNTAGPWGIALQGEYSYRPNQPVQLSGIEVILAAGGLANNITGATVPAASVPIGTEITGYRRVQMHQTQLTATKAFGPTFGAEQLAVVGEVGYTYLNLPSGLQFAGPGVVLPAVGSSTATTSGSTQPGMAGYATTGSWGYRLLGRLDYPDVIAGGTLSPRIGFSHDVHGVSPTFNQGTKAATFGLTYNLKQKWAADLAYTTYWGGRTYSGTDTPALVPAGQSPSYATSANPLKDRDFLSLSVSYAF